MDRIESQSTESQAVRLASGSLFQQIAQVTGLVAMFAIITVLARRLALSQLGIYGLLTSIAGYLLIIQNAAGGAAVRSMASAHDRAGRDRAFSTAAALYLAAGLTAGVLVAGIGLVLAQTVDLPAAVRSQARIGALLLGAVTAVGWPATVYRDALRAAQQFTRAAITDIAALVVYAATLLALAFAGARLSVLIGASGAIPLLSGAGCFIVARASRVPFALEPAAVSRTAGRELLSTAGYLSLTEAAAAAIYTINRAILGLFTSAATVALFEGPIRVHNLLRALNGAVTVTALPTASRYEAEGDRRRLRELVVRGARYTLALMAPIAVTGMVLAAPLLGAWLGPRFRAGGGALAILLSHWTVNGCSGLFMATLVGLGRARQVAAYAAAVAAGNVVIALALTPLIGLEGVAVATAAPYLAMFPVLVRLTTRASGVELGELARRAFRPAWTLALPLAAGLGALRIALDPRSAPLVAALAIGAVGSYWLAFYALAMEPSERTLVRDVVRTVLRRA